MLEQLQEHGRLPEALIADTAERRERATGGGCRSRFDRSDLRPSPTNIRRRTDALTLDDFAHHEETGAVEA